MKQIITVSPARRFFLKSVKLSGIIFLLIAHQQNLLAQKQSFLFEDVRRYYEVHTPQEVEADMPLVIVFHGAWGTIDIQKEWSATHLHADTAGYIVVYVQGVDNMWNFGVDYCPIRGKMPNVNDVGFISALIDTVYNNYTIDLERVYCIGWSTGGEMCFRLACEMGQKFAAIASVGGGMCDAANDWHPAKAMPVMEIHGTLDLYYQYGGPGSHPEPVYTMGDEEWSIDKVLNYWVENNSCNPEGDTIDMPDLVTDDNCTAQKIRYSGGEEGSEVVHYKIINGGHSWPGSTTNHPYWDGEGNRNLDINANEEIWNFFKQHKNLHVNIDETSANNSNLKVYPNPANERIHYDLKMGSGNMIIEIIDLSGKIILRREIFTNAKLYSGHIDISELIAGVYFFRISASKSISTTKVLIQ